MLCCGIFQQYFDCRRWNAEPNDFDGQENCGLILQDGSFNDFSCFKPLSYICELQSEGNFFAIRCIYGILVLQNISMQYMYYASVVQLCYRIQRLYLTHCSHRFPSNRCPLSVWLDTVAIRGRHQLLLHQQHYTRSQGHVVWVTWSLSKVDHENGWVPPCNKQPRRTGKIEPL